MYGRVRGLVVLPQESCSPANGSARPPASAQCAAALCQAAPVYSGRPVSLGLVGPSVARLACGAGDRQTRNGDWLALSGLPLVLDLESAPRATGTTQGGGRGARTHPPDEPGKSAVGSSAYSRRAAQSRHRCGRDQCRQVHDARREAAITNLADFSGKSRQEHGLGGFFTVPTIRFQVLYVFLVLAHDRRL